MLWIVKRYVVMLVLPTFRISSVDIQNRELRKKLTLDDIQEL